MSPTPTNTSTSTGTQRPTNTSQSTTGPTFTIQSTTGPTFTSQITTGPTFTSQSNTGPTPNFGITPSITNSGTNPTLFSDRSTFSSPGPTLSMSSSSSPSVNLASSSSIIVNSTLAPIVSSVSGPSATPSAGTTRGPRPYMGLNALPGETKLGDIVTKELNTITTNETEVSNMQTGKTRMNLLNDTYRKRYLDYIKILIVIVIGLALMWIFVMLESMGFIPNYLNNFIIVAVLSIALIISYNIYANIQTHDLLNYDELSIKSPDLYVAPTGTPVSTTTTVPGGTSSSNVGLTCTSPPTQDMCGSGTVYDMVSKKCVSGAMTLFN